MHAGPEHAPRSQGIVDSRPGFSTCFFVGLASWPLLPAETESRVAGGSMERQAPGGKLRWTGVRPSRSPDPAPAADAAAR